MKNVEVNKILISYNDNNVESDKVVLFLHANSHSKEFFDQFIKNSETLKKYRVIALDLPGHGDSEKLESYSLEVITQYVFSFIKVLNLKNVFVVGHSFGGHIAIELLNFFEPVGLLIWGAPPQTKESLFQGFLPNDLAKFFFSDNATQREIQSLAKILKYENLYYEELFISTYLKTDPEFRVQIPQSLFDKKFYDEVDLLSKNPNKLTCLISKNDSLIDSTYLDKILTKTNQSFEVWDGGHSILFNKPIEFDNFISVIFKRYQF